MRVVVAHHPGCDVRALRQVLLGAGLDCAAGDCVAWDDLAVRLSCGEAGLVLVSTVGSASPVGVNERLGASPGAEGPPCFDWGRLREALSLTQAPVVAVGPEIDDTAVAAARSAGVAYYLDAADLRNELDAMLERLTMSNGKAAHRGTVISVMAPTPGSGGSTVAANLAGALLKSHPKGVALVELARDSSDLALLLNVSAGRSTQEVCQRWQSLDAVALKGCVTEHRSGLQLLLNPSDHSGNSGLSVEAVRRIGVLSRGVFAATVLALESRPSDEALEAMRLSDAVTLVVRADVPSVLRARWVIETALEQGVEREKVRVVVNRWGQGGQLSQKQLESGLGVKADQFIPDDPRRVNRAANEGLLLKEISSGATISRRFAHLAKAVNGA